MKDTWKIKLRHQLVDPTARTAALEVAGYWLAALAYWELILHIAVFGTPDVRIGYVLGFSFVFACVLSLATVCVSGKLKFWIMMGAACILLLLYGSQMVYFFVFGNLYSVAHIQQGGAAVTSFWRETMSTILNNLPWVLSLLIPVVLLVVLKRFRDKLFFRASAIWHMIIAAAAVLVAVALMYCLPMGGTGYFTDYYFYHSETTTTDQAAERFGLLTAFRLDMTDSGNVAAEDKNDAYRVPETVVTEPLKNAASEPVETEPEVTYNVLNIDFDALNANTTDETILAINQYCASLTGTNKNAYTGMLKDYNLILICAESFATGAIHEELTPTLYHMMNNGIVFNNFYNTYPNNTTDGEYTLCMGIYPDTTRSKTTASFYASRDSYLPFCLGNIFSEQRGIQSYGYHNYIGSYYGRDESHPNMGYTMEFADSGMNISGAWPASDLEMMEKTIDDYIGQDQFHAYYMTFSGHLMYSVDQNAMAAKNWKLVRDLEGLNNASKCYLACNIELDWAVEYLMQRLEEAGVADKTAIVLVGDHYPYGLSDEQYSQLMGYKVDGFTKYKSSLLFWVGGLEENIVVDEYCCNADVLPTILNLWGFDYDSRLLAGTDVFSDGTHVAVLRDMSFFTDKVWLNASTGEIKYLVDESELPDHYVDNLIRLVQTKFSLSADILNKAYYNYVFSAGNVVVERDVWGADPDGAGAIGPNTPVEMPEDATEQTNPPQDTPAETQVPDVEETTGGEEIPATNATEPASPETGTVEGTAPEGSEA